MTLYLNIGRRVPKNWFKRIASKTAGLVDFQQNMWIMISESFNKAKRAAQASGQIKWVHKRDTENDVDDPKFQIEWIKIIIQGTREQEQEEFDDCSKLYGKFGKHFKKKFPVDNELSKSIKSKVVDGIKMNKAYDKGFGVMNEVSMVSKLLELGIMTHIDLVDDHDTRDKE